MTVDTKKWHYLVNQGWCQQICVRSYICGDLSSLSNPNVSARPSNHVQTYTHKQIKANSTLRCGAAKRAQPISTVPSLGTADLAEVAVLHLKPPVDI